MKILIIFRRSLVSSSIENLEDSNRLVKRTLLEQLNGIL